MKYVLLFLLLADFCKKLSDMNRIQLHHIIKNKNTRFVCTMGLTHLIKLLNLL